jgi:hypothetical protein
MPEEDPSTHPVQNQQMQQMRNGNQTPQTNKGQQSYARGKTMHVDAEVAQENPRVVLGMFLVNCTPALVFTTRNLSFYDKIHCDEVKFGHIM